MMSNLCTGSRAIQIAIHATTYALTGSAICLVLGPGFAIGASVRAAPSTRKFHEHHGLLVEKVSDVRKLLASVIAGGTTYWTPSLKEKNLAMKN